jgi:hypothetical protein
MSEKTPAIFGRMADIMAAIEPIAKTRKNVEQHYTFRGIDDVMNELGPLMAKHRVFVLTDIIEANRSERTTQKGSVLLYARLRVKITFMTDDGSSVSSTVEGEGMDSGDKATNKALSAALKYACLQTFMIPTAEQKDSENESPKPAASKPAGRTDDPYIQGLETLKKMQSEAAIPDGEISTIIHQVAERPDATLIQLTPQQIKMVIARVAKRAGEKGGANA